MTLVTYGEGGYCADCDPSHDHPLHNIIEQVEVPDVEDASAIALESALAKLQKLGLTEDEVLALLRPTA